MTTIGVARKPARRPVHWPRRPSRYPCGGRSHRVEFQH